MSSVQQVLAGLGGGSGPPQFVAGSSGSSTAPGTYTVSTPAGIQNGDLLIIVTGWASTSDGAPGLDPGPAYGETEVVELYADDSRDANLSVSYLWVGASPPSSLTVTAAGGGMPATTVMQAWRGVNQSTPMDVTATTATGANTTYADGPSISPITANSVVLSCFLSTLALTSSATTPSGYSNATTKSDEGSYGAICGIASKTWSGTGAEDPGVWTMSTDTFSDSWCAVTLALRPA